MEVMISVKDLVKKYNIYNKKENEYEYTNY